VRQPPHLRWIENAEARQVLTTALSEAPAAAPAPTSQPSPTSQGTGSQWGRLIAGWLPPAPPGYADGGGGRSNSPIAAARGSRPKP
jgi:hypothetical protein